MPEQTSVGTSPRFTSPKTFAFRLSDKGAEFVCTRETAFYQNIASLAKGCDLLIHDGTFLGGHESLAKPTNHSTAKDAGKFAHDAKMKRSVLIHIAPANENSESRYIEETGGAFDGEIVVARQP